MANSIHLEAFESNEQAIQRYTEYRKSLLQRQSLSLTETDLVSRMNLPWLPKRGFGMGQLRQLRLVRAFVWLLTCIESKLAHPEKGPRRLKGSSGEAGPSSVGCERFCALRGGVVPEQRELQALCSHMRGRARISYLGCQL